MTRRGRRAEIVNRETLVCAALEIANSQGLEVLTIRRLAAKVNLPPMTLYGYFENKDALLDAMADHVLGGLDISTISTNDPSEAVYQLGVAFFDTMHDQPGVAQLLATRSTTSEQAMAAAFEAPLNLLIGIGYDQTEAVRIYGLLFTYALGFSCYQLPRPWGGNDDHSLERRRQRELLYRALPIDRFPTMVRLSEKLVTLPSRDQFSWGLGVLVAGISPVPRRKETPVSSLGGRGRGTTSGQ